jgi:hypothetical protein
MTAKGRRGEGICEMSSTVFKFETSLVVYDLKYHLKNDFKRLGCKFSDEAPPPTPLLESVEDNYISQTSSSPPVVTCGETGAVLGLSVEGAVMHILRALEVGNSPRNGLFPIKTEISISRLALFAHALVQTQPFNSLFYANREKQSDALYILFKIRVISKSNAKLHRQQLV